MTSDVRKTNSSFERGHESQLYRGVHSNQEKFAWEKQSTLYSLVSFTLIHHMKSDDQRASQRYLIIDVRQIQIKYWFTFEKQTSLYFIFLRIQNSHCRN